MAAGFVRKYEATGNRVTISIHDLWSVNGLVRYVSRRCLRRYLDSGLNGLLVTMAQSP
jgi:hypothetical protein